MTDRDETRGRRAGAPEGVRGNGRVHELSGSCHASARNYRVAPTQKRPSGEQSVVSVLIAARNAAQTLPETLRSLAEQTLRDWEAIVVDDGSSDATAAIADAVAVADPRVRVVRRAEGGVSAARNTALEHARSDLIAFLDADDWLAPQALERLAGVLAARPHVDGVHCGWIRIGAGGHELRQICPCGDEDLLALHARGCAFAIHAALVRRDLIDRAGGFDTSLVACEDWDLWLRLSRLGARWERLEEYLAYYRTRPESASMDAHTLLRDGLIVVDRAHAPPPAHDPSHHPGASAAERSHARLSHAAYSAALATGQGGDGVAHLAPLRDDRCRHLEPEDIGHALYEGVTIGAAAAAADWPTFAPELLDGVRRLLDELERISGAPALALRATRVLHRLVTETSGTCTLFADVATVCPDLERPLENVAVAPGTTRLHVRARYGSLELPLVELPAFDGSVGAAAIADAVAAAHAWALLGEFLGTTQYPELDVSAVDGWLEVRRGDQVLVEQSLHTGEDEACHSLHDHVGWLVFLQEAWGDRSACDGSFYHAAHDAELRAARDLPVTDGWACLEISDPPAHVTTRARVLVCATVAGVALDSWMAAPHRGLIPAGALRRELCSRAGFELCRLVVREALLGQPIADGASLRDRLRSVASARAGAVATADARPVSAPAGFALAPGWEARARMALTDRCGYVIGARRSGTVGSSTSRPAAFPSRAAERAVQAARATGDPVIVVGVPAAGAPAAYASDLIWHEAAPAAGVHPPGRGPAAEPRGPGRGFFETLFASGTDPWRYSTEYERLKYEQTLSLVGEPPPARALEIACAEGHFTAMLAPHVGELVACDVSTIALHRSRARCARHPNVRFAFHDIFADPIQGRYDLIVCSEVLYYAGDRQDLRHATAAIAGALAGGGTLLTVHANLVVDDPQRPGFDWPLPFGARVIGEALVAAGLELQVELGNPIYRVQAYRARQARPLWRRTPAVRGAAPLPDKLPSVVGETFLWEGGAPSAGAEVAEEVTSQLPILMYHRVGPTGSDELRRWRVTPGAFEEQLHYLRTSGHRSATLAEWRTAAERHQPLPGKRVLLTFDDGYEDFAEHAWPLLRQYGFDATVFLVSGLVGGVNEWDGHVGETVALMDWATIRALDGEGVQFGGHSVSHPMLTAVGLAEVVDQVASCREALARELGRPLPAFAYPYGDVDCAVARLVGTCGFEYAVTTAGHRASATESMLLLPRIEVAGTNSFETFVTNLIPLT